MLTGAGVIILLFVLWPLAKKLVEFIKRQNGLGHTRHEIPSDSNTNANQRPQNSVPNPTNATQQIPGSASSWQEKDAERIYALIAMEFEVGIANKGLWTRLYAECEGDEKKTKVLYIKQRAAALLAINQASENSPPAQEANSIFTAQSSCNDGAASPHIPNRSELLEKTPDTPSGITQSGVANPGDAKWRCFTASILLLSLAIAQGIGWPQRPLSGGWWIIILEYAGIAIGIHGLVAIIGYSLAKMRPAITYPGWITVALAWLTAITIGIPALREDSKRSQDVSTLSPTHKPTEKPKGLVPFYGTVDPGTSPAYKSSEVPKGLKPFEGALDPAIPFPHRSPEISASTQDGLESATPPAGKNYSGFDPSTARPVELDPRTARPAE